MTGKLPFGEQDESEYEIMQQIVVNSIPAIKSLRPDVTNAIDDIISMTTKKNIEERISSCSELYRYVVDNSRAFYDDEIIKSLSAFDLSNTPASFQLEDEQCKVGMSINGYNILAPMEFINDSELYLAKKNSSYYILQSINYSDYILTHPFALRNFAKSLIQMSHIFNPLNTVVCYIKYFIWDYRFYIVWDYEKATPLKRIIEDRGRQTEKFVLKVVYELAVASDYLKYHNYLDFKLDSYRVWITARGHVLVRPFLIDNLRDGLNLTSEEQLFVYSSDIGFKAREQYPEAKEGPEDESTVIYRIGMIMYHMLTGKLPYYNYRDNIIALTRNMIDGRQKQLILPVNDISDSCKKIFYKMSCIDKRNRYQNFGQLLFDLINRTDPEHRMEVDEERDDTIIITNEIFLKCNVCNMYNLHNDYKSTTRCIYCDNVIVNNLRIKCSRCGTMRKVKEFSKFTDDIPHAEIMCPDCNNHLGIIYLLEKRGESY